MSPQKLPGVDRAVVWLGRWRERLRVPTPVKATALRECTGSQGSIWAEESHCPDSNLNPAIHGCTVWSKGSKSACAWFPDLQKRF